MRLLEVLTPAQAREFLLFPVRLYADTPAYVRPLNQDIEGVFDRVKNKYFQHGDLIRWLLVDNGGQTLGRVAAFVDERTSRTAAQPTGGMGFFECIDDQLAANVLFDGCRTWLTGRGIEAMDGPINFGDRDQWWGMLLDNFGPPLYGQNFNPPYYRRLVEAYGFEVYFNQYTYFRKLAAPFSPEFLRRAARVGVNPEYSFEHLRLNNLAKYTEDFRQVYNKAWVKHDGVEEMTPAQSAHVLQKLRPIIDERVCWFAYYRGEAVGFIIALPELNELFQHVDGSLDLLGKLKFAWHRWRGAVHTLTGIVFGIVPAHQRKGLEMGFVLEAAKMLQDPTMPYDDLVMNWVGDFNPKMMRVAEAIGGTVWRTHATYRYLFDRTKPFVRASGI